MAPKKSRNVGSATAVGVGAGAAGASLIVYGSTIVAAKTGIPAEVVAPVLGSLFGFVARWAAKLNPNE